MKTNRLITCYSCGARIEFGTNLRGDMVETKIPCKCPQKVVEPRACKCGTLLFDEFQKVCEPCLRLAIDEVYGQNLEVRYCRYCKLVPVEKARRTCTSCRAKNKAKHKPYVSRRLAA